MYTEYIIDTSIYSLSSQSSVPPTSFHSSSVFCDSGELGLLRS